MVERSFKFRAWNKKQNKMFYTQQDGFALSFTSNGWCVGDVDIVAASDSGDVLMQSTSLSDKNGKEIFEGDIVVKDKYIWFDDGIPNYRGTVEWIFSQWQVVAHCVNHKKNGISDGINQELNDDGFEEGGKTNWEIIGNIYENSEMLGKNEDQKI